jgi:hypothetical protein
MDGRLQIVKGSKNMESIRQKRMKSTKHVDEQNRQVVSRKVLRDQEWED